MMIAAVAAAVISCKNDNKSTWEEYSDWRKLNETFFEEQQYRTDGGSVSTYYTTVSPAWDPGAKILIRYLNNRALTAGNLTPLFNSTCSVKYIGRLYDGEPFDSSYNLTDSVYQLQPSNVIQGWTIALMQMHVGDSAQIVIPYQQAYGSTGSMRNGIYVIKPFSTLVFNLKLVDIPYYEVRP